MKIPSRKLKKRIHKVKLEERTRTSQDFIDRHAEELRTAIKIKDIEHTVKIKNLVDEYEKKLKNKDDELRILIKRDADREMEYKNFLTQKGRLERLGSKIENITKTLADGAKGLYVEARQAVDEVDTVIYLENKQRAKRS